MNKPQVNIEIQLIQKDITTLEAECIVNAANETGMGCHRPGHPCVDRAIHERAGERLTQHCTQIMSGLGRELHVTEAFLTPAYDLPSKWVIHVLGPKKQGPNDPLRMDLLKASYTSCLDLCAANGIREVAFCCISTGMYGYPHYESARAAIETVGKWIAKQEGRPSVTKIIFCCYKAQDYLAYNSLLTNSSWKIK